MPRILIRELDKTQAGSIITSNFTVLVPGKCGTPTSTEKVFDDNGVYECSSTSDFVAHIGKTGPIETSGDGEYAAPDDIKTSGTDPVYVRPVTANEFYSTFKGKIYHATESTTEEPAGYLKLKVEVLPSTEPKTYKYYKCDKVLDSEQWDENEANGKHVSESLYCVIEPENEGKEASNVMQIGNQIAYELIRCGYTVMFKKFDSINELNDPAFWGVLKDKAVYNFRYVISGLVDEVNSTGITVSSIYAKIKDLVDGTDISSIDDMGRGDCVALFDVPKCIYKDTVGTGSANAIKAYVDSKGSKSAYCAWFAPAVTLGNLDDKSAFGNNTTFPASFVYLACAAKAADQYPEWYAVSGYKRGVSNYSIQGVSVKLGEKAVNVLQPRKEQSAIAVNIILTEKTNYYLWGNRTAYSLNEGLVASNFLNIRQLCTTVKKQIYTACRNLMFEPNSDLLWLNFCNAIRPTLEQMKAQQGIKDYKFEKKETELKAKLFAAVRIIPIEAVEDFEIAVTLEDNFDEENISITEKLG